MHFFYQPNLSAEFIHLDEDESKHAIRVLRIVAGDQVEVVDGKGQRVIAEVSKDHPKRCELRIISRVQEPSPRPYYLHVAVAPTKSIDRIEWFLEKAVEIGIDEVSFLECENSERTVVKMERMEKVAVSAMKQSQQSRIPILNQPMLFSEFIQNSKAENKFIAHCEETAKSSFHTFLPQSKSILMLIGPEGDFSTEEINLSKENGYSPVSLGATRLRTETAAMYTVMSTAFAFSPE